MTGGEHAHSDHARDDHRGHAHSRAHACQPLGDPVITLRRAQFGYGGHVSAHVDHLEIRAHEVVALLGPNGSGKTTLM